MSQILEYLFVYITSSSIEMSCLFIILNVPTCSLLVTRLFSLVLNFSWVFDVGGSCVWTVSATGSRHLYNDCIHRCARADCLPDVLRVCSGV